MGRRSGVDGGEVGVGGVRILEPVAPSEMAWGLVHDLFCGLEDGGVRLDGIACAERFCACPACLSVAIIRGLCGCSASGWGGGILFFREPKQTKDNGLVTLA